MKELWPPLLIALLAIALFSPILRHDFTDLDDPQTIADNPDLRPPTPASLAHLWSVPAAGLYVPITYSAWWLTAHIGFRDGTMHAWPFHLLSLSLHAGCGILIWLLLRRLQYSPLASACGAVLFVVHPVQVEPVAWTSGAKDLLAAFFSLAAMAIYFKASALGHDIPSITPATSGPDSAPLYPVLGGEGTRQRIAWVSILLFTLGMLAKPSAVVAPFILAAIDRLYFHRPLRCTFRRLWPVVFALVPIILVARSVQTIWPAVVTPLWTRPLIAGDTLAFYLVHLLWPATLTHLYGRTPMLVVASPSLYWSWLLPAVAGLLVLAMARRVPGIAAGAAIFIVGLLPVLGLTPFEFQIHSTVADHYLYLPMFGLSLATAAMLQKSTRLGPIIAGAWLVALAVRTECQLPVWQNSVALNQHAVDVRPRSVDAHGSLAIALAEAGRLEDAAPHLEFVVANAPASRMAHLRLAQVYLGLHRFSAALPQALAATQLTSPMDRDPWPDILLSDALAGLKHRDEAIAALQAAGRIDPNNAAIAERLAALRAATTQP